jgi:hypothetical protein
MTTDGVVEVGDGGRPPGLDVVEQLGIQVRDRIRDTVLLAGEGGNAVVLTGDGEFAERRVVATCTAELRELQETGRGLGDQVTLGPVDLPVKVQAPRTGAATTAPPWSRPVTAI